MKKKHLVIDDLFHGLFFTVCPLSIMGQKFMGTNTLADFSRKIRRTREAEEYFEKMPSSRYKYEDLISQGFVFAIEPSELQKQANSPEKGHFNFLRQTLLCSKPGQKRCDSAMMHR